MKTIVNLTDLKIDGSVELPEKYKKKINKLMAPEKVPSVEEVEEAAKDVVNTIEKFLLDPLSPVREEFKEIKKADYEGVGDLGLVFIINPPAWLCGELTWELECLGEVQYSFIKDEKIAGFVPSR